MMEGEEESSFDVTGNDIDLGYEERPVNRYGSPIAGPAGKYKLSQMVHM